MSTEKFAELLKDERPGGAGQALREGIQAVAPGLSLGKILSDVGSELSHQGQAGAHELASALFRGDAFVMYPKAGQEIEGHGLPQQEQDRAGREM